MSLARAGFIAAMMAAFAACQRPAGDEARLKDQVREIRELTMPPGCRLLSSSEPRLEGSTLKAEWGFEAKESLKDYSAWLRAKLAPRFQERANDPLSFSSHEGGDWQSLSFKVTPSTTGLRVHASYFSLPD